MILDIKKRLTLEQWNQVKALSPERAVRYQNEDSDPITGFYVKDTEEVIKQIQILIDTFKENT